MHAYPCEFMQAGEIGFRPNQISSNSQSSLLFVIISLLSSSRIRALPQDSHLCLLLCLSTSSFGFAKTSPLTLDHLLGYRWKRSEHVTGDSTY